jgi:3-oxoacyl-[acyl-carrier-protein] synthase-3
VDDVYITRTASFLPHDPVANDDIETYLGMVGGRPSRIRRIILGRNGINSRHYALGPGRERLTNAALVARAVRALLPGDDLAELRLLACGTTSPDQILPGHASMVHGELGIGPVETYSFSGACNAGMQALKTAFLSVGSGNAPNAVATGSERMSAQLTADKFAAELEKILEVRKNGYIAFEKDFLRWMLSDGAGALLMEPAPDPARNSLKVEWVEMVSFAGELEPCMYAGGVKSGSTLIGYHDLDPAEWMANSVFAIRQDVKLLERHIVPKAVEFVTGLVDRGAFDPAAITWFLPHLSSAFFADRIREGLAAAGIGIAADAWFTNLDRVGNVGSASVYLMLDELVRSGRLAAGDKILVCSPESARFSYAAALLTAV